MRLLTYIILLIALNLFITPLSYWLCYYKITCLDNKEISKLVVAIVIIIDIIVIIYKKNKGNEE